MLFFLKDVWSWLRDWSVFVLPAFSNLILVLLGVVMSLPALAEKIEQTPRYRKCLAAVCFIAGLIGFAFDVVQRRSSDQTAKQVLGEVSAAVKNTNDLVEQSSVLVATTNQMATTVAISIPQIAELDSQVAAIDERLKTTSDPHLIAELRAQKTEEQERSAAISKKMAIAFVPEIVNQMRDSARKYDEDLYRSYEETNEPTSFPPSPTKTKELAQVLADRSILTSRHQTEMSQMVSIADYLRGQLVQGIPQIDEDKTEAQSFAAAINGDITSFDVRKATTYLEDLVGRNR